jgi:hypothetical protein
VILFLYKVVQQMNQLVGLLEQLMPQQVKLLFQQVILKCGLK